MKKQIINQFFNDTTFYQTIRQESYSIRLNPYLQHLLHQLTKHHEEDFVLPDDLESDHGSRSNVHFG